MSISKISIVSPVYKAREIIPYLIEKIIQVVQTLTDNYEIILVDDGCPDNSWVLLEEAAKKIPENIWLEQCLERYRKYKFEIGK